MQFHFHANQSHFHKNGFALRLALKQTHKGTQKWPIMLLFDQDTKFYVVHVSVNSKSLTLTIRITEGKCTSHTSMNKLFIDIQVGTPILDYIYQSTYHFNDIGQDSNKIHKNILTCFLEIQASNINFSIKHSFLIM